MERIYERANKCCFFMGRPPMKEACAELLATFVLVLLGDGVMASCVLGRLQVNSVLAGAFGWGFAMMVAVAISGGISGGHVNPAVTIGLASSRKCGWRHVIPNIIAQYVGSFLAACAVYVAYKDAINEFDNGSRQIPPSANATAQIFATYPQEFATIGTCIFDQIVGSALLLIVICAATDTKNLRVPPHTQPMVIGLGLTAIALAFGYNCGAPLNPARDLAPRFFTAIGGWGLGVFSYRNYQWFWIPVVAPIIGAIIGVWLYKLLIELPFKNYSDFLDEIESAFKNITKMTASPAAKSDASRSMCTSASPDVAGKSTYMKNGVLSSPNSSDVACVPIFPDVKVVPSGKAPSGISTVRI